MRKRERERERESVCVCVCVRERERERERERVFHVKSASILTYFHHSDYVTSPIQDQTDRISSLVRTDFSCKTSRKKIHNRQCLPNLVYCTHVPLYVSFNILLFSCFLLLSSEVFLTVSLGLFFQRFLKRKPTLRSVSSWKPSCSSLWTHTHPSFMWRSSRDGKFSNHVWVRVSVTLL